jgi:MFS family permease
MKLTAVRASVLGSLDTIRRAWPLLAIALLVDSAFLFVFLIALQSYLPEALGVSEAIAPWSLAAFGLAKLSTQVGSGFVTDRLGTKRTLAMGVGMLFAANVAILPLAHSAPALIVAAGAIYGLGSSLTWPAVYAAGDATFAAGEKGRFTALLTLATGGALVVGLGGGTALNNYASFNTAMLAPITSAGLALVLTLFVGARGALAIEHNEMPRFGDLRALLTHPQRAAFAMLVLCEAAALGALTSAFRAYGRDVLDVSLARQAMYLLPAAVIGGLIVVPGGALADRLGARRVMVPGFAVTGIALMLLARWSDPAFVMAAAGAAGAGFGLAVPAIASTMMTLAGSTGRRGGAIGWFMTMDGIGHAAGPAAAGVLLAVADARAVLVMTGVLFLGVAYVALASRLGEGMREVTPVEGTGARVEPATGGQP